MFWCVCFVGFLPGLVLLDSVFAKKNGSKSLQNHHLLTGKEGVCTFLDLCPQKMGHKADHEYWEVTNMLIMTAWIG